MLFRKRRAKEFEAALRIRESILEKQAFEQKQLYDIMLDARKREDEINRLIDMMTQNRKRHIIQEVI